MTTGHKMYLEQSEYIKELEAALDKACKLMDKQDVRRPEDDCTQSWLEWKEWCLKDEK